MFASFASYDFVCLGAYTIFSVAMFTSANARTWRDQLTVHLSPAVYERVHALSIYSYVPPVMYMLGLMLFNLRPVCMAGTGHARCATSLAPILLIVHIYACAYASRIDHDELKTKLNYKSELEVVCHYFFFSVRQR